MVMRTLLVPRGVLRFNVTYLSQAGGAILLMMGECLLGVPSAHELLPLASEMVRLGLQLGASWSPGELVLIGSIHAHTPGSSVSSVLCPGLQRHDGVSVVIWSVILHMED